MKEAVVASELAKWLAQIEQYHPNEIELGLERTEQVLARMSLDLSSSFIISIAGTNGKGSTVEYLKTIYQQAGYSVGSYTSPHITAYNERISLNGHLVSDSLLCEAFSEVENARGDTLLTYFEFGTLAALWLFSVYQPNLILLEVGMGGRLDAVNVIDADIAIITTISLDHTEWLGNSRELIGYEKSGIFRAGKVAICGDLNPPESIEKAAHKTGTKLLQAGKSFFFSPNIEQGKWDWQGLDDNGDARYITSIPQPQLAIQNAATVLQAIQFIPLTLSIEVLYSGIKHASLKGRMQHYKSGQSEIWLDVAHNPEAIQLLVQKIRNMGGNNCIILGMLSDKDCQQVVQLLAPWGQQLYLVGLNTSRAAKPDILATYIPKSNNVQQYANVAAALSALKNNTNKFDNVIITGSFFTVSEALSILEKEE